MIYFWSMWGTDTSFTVPLGKEDCYPCSHRENAGHLSCGSNQDSSMPHRVRVENQLRCCGCIAALSSTVVIPTSHERGVMNSAPHCTCTGRGRLWAGEHQLCSILPARTHHCSQPGHRNTEAGKSEIPAPKDKQPPH